MRRIRILFKPFSVVLKSLREKRALRENFISLTALQAVQFILPLITLPYLVSTLGVDRFGLVVFAQALMSFFWVVADLGFGLSATRSIAVSRENREEVNAIVSSVMLIKLALIIILFVVLVLLILFIDRLRHEASLYLVSFIVVVGQTMVASWFFQGFEDMRHITNIVLIMRLLFTIMIFVFIKSGEDYIYVPLLNGAGYLLAGCISLYMMAWKYKVSFVNPGFEVIKKIFADSLQYFISRIANDGNQAYTTLLIGLVHGDAMVGYYSMAEKLYRPVYSLLAPITQSMYPYMASNKDLSLYKQLFVAVVSIAFAIVTMMIFFKTAILGLMYGDTVPIVGSIYNVIFIGAYFGIVSSLLGYPLLAAFGYSYYANISLVYASIISFAYTNIAVLMGAGVVQLALTLVLFEFFGCIMRIYYAKQVTL